MGNISIRNMFFFLLALFFLPLNGQNLEEIFKKHFADQESGNLISECISSELSIIRQQYRLARNGKTYGKNNMPYFGETYSLGIKISNGMIISNSVVEPWKNDSDFKRLNTSDQYKPELFWSYQRALNTTEYNAIDFEFGTDYIHPIDSNHQLYTHEEKKGDFGLAIDATPGEKAGYMVWVYTETNLQDSAMTVSVMQNPMRIVASEDSARITVKVNEPEKVLGGLYIAPKYERGGRIQLQVIGIAVPVENNEKKWELSLLTKGIAEKKTATVNTTGEDEKGSLEPTPIESSKEKPEDKSKKKKK